MPIVDSQRLHHILSWLHETYLEAQGVQEVWRGDNAPHQALIIAYNLVSATATWVSL
jgi:hypothetical protein